MIYLDNAATTYILPNALYELNNALRNPANPNSSHVFGHEAAYDLQEARDKIALCINAEPDEIYFTSGATESCGIALNYLSNKCGITTVSPFEHHAVLGFKLRSNFHNPRRGLVQMLVNNETGEIFSMPNRGTALDRELDRVFTDATAAMGHMDIDVKKLDVDMLAAGGHKFGAPCGVGFLYARRGIEIKRGGTPPVPLIVSMASALAWNVQHMKENTEAISEMREIFINGLKNTPDCIINGEELPSRYQLPHILNISFAGADGKTLAMMCSKRDVLISAGAACSNGKNEPSHVLMAKYHDEARARSAVRISFSHENTFAGVEKAAKIVAECVEQLRAIK